MKNFTTLEELLTDEAFHTAYDGRNGPQPATQPTSQKTLALRP
jgi:hypothetical protein